MAYAPVGTPPAAVGLGSSYKSQPLRVPSRGAAPQAATTTSRLSSSSLAGLDSSLASMATSMSTSTRRRSLASSPTVSPEAMAGPSIASVTSGNVVAFRQQAPGSKVVGFETSPRSGASAPSPFSTLCGPPEAAAVPFGAAGGLSSALKPPKQVASVQRSQGLLAKALSLTELQRVLPQASSNTALVLGPLHADAARPVCREGMDAA